MNFKEYLDTLKLSAKEAIVDGELASLSDLKNYLHIDRVVEQDLTAIFRKVAAAPTAQLILLLGNVGDGKSHLLAKLWEKHQAEMELFCVYNDATESLSKNKTYLDNLSEVFQPYSDEALVEGTSTTKTIIAINLGTLTNFLEEAGEGFSKLAAYVRDNHLVDQYYSAEPPTPHDYFNALNLADYHIFTLSPQGAKSVVLLEIIRKITANTSDNYFYQAYLEAYHQTSQAYYCPMRYNYELLAQPAIQEALNELLIRTVIADKLIVSVRLLMNFIYDLLVPSKFSTLTQEAIQEMISSPSYIAEFSQDTMISLLFESTATSTILKNIQQYDPVSHNEGHLDELMMQLSTSGEPANYFTAEHLLEASDPLISCVSELSIPQRIKLFVRLRFLKNSGRDEQYATFQSFTQLLYNFNAGEKKVLLKFYDQVAHAIYQWNGSSGTDDEKFINLDIGRKQSMFKISRKLELEYAPMERPKPAGTTLHKFLKNIGVCFEVEQPPEEMGLEIDFPLFELIQKINKGYWPNRIDRTSHVKFTEFVNKLIKFRSATKELLIQEFNGENKQQFKLSYRPKFGTYQFSEVR